MLKKLFRKTESDRGSSALISFIFIVPLFLALVVTIFDLSFYFSNRGQVEAIARDAVRTVSIFGGNGEQGASGRGTSIEVKYGLSWSEACSNARVNGMPQPIADEFNSAKGSGGSTPVECNAIFAMVSNPNLVATSISKAQNEGGNPDNGVVCGPTQAQAIGSRVFCTITYTYQQLPGSPLSFVNLRDDNGNVIKGALSQNVVTKTAESEVMLPTLVPRNS